jgi:hypothetical protein
LRNVEEGEGDGATRLHRNGSVQANGECARSESRCRECDGAGAKPVSTDDREHCPDAGGQHGGQGPDGRHIRGDDPEGVRGQDREQGQSRRRDLVSGTGGKGG